MTMPREPGSEAPLFTFAVLGDTHVNPDDDRSSSPWRTNALANRRAAAVVAQINRLRPDFAVHLGDMVHPVPTSPGYGAAARRFGEIFSALEVPLHLVPGNHDVGDKPTAWSPAAPVSSEALAVYARHFGADHYAFDHRGCRFVVVNNEIFNSGLDCEHDQWSWLAGQLDAGQRTFLFTHYPPYLQAADEIEHYDNLAEPARTRFVSMIAARVEAIFCGHVHNFFYNRMGATDCYVAPATSAVRHDYAELFSVPPAGDEHGRDLASKLGFFFVEVFESGHVAHFVHSRGEVDAERAAMGTSKPAANVKDARAAPLGVDLRGGWADVVSVPYSGAVDEFTRKPVRNDYLVLALWEVGLRRLRIPFNDLVADRYARRVADLGAIGHRFTVFGYGLPDNAEAAAIARFAPFIEGIEIIGRMPGLPQLAQAAGRLRAESGVPVFLSKLRVSADAAHDGASFAHFIRHGFRSREKDLAAGVEAVRGAGLDGLAFSIPWSKPAGAEIETIAGGAAAAGIRALAHVHLAGDDPAAEITDEGRTAARVAEAALAAWQADGRLLVFLDTLCNHDRGYFPRPGLVDRKYDLRPAGEMLKLLVAMRSVALAGPAAGGAFEDVQLVGTTAGKPLSVLARNGAEVPTARSNGLATARGGELSAFRLDTCDAIEPRLEQIDGGLRISCTGAPDGTPVLILLSPERRQTVVSE